MRVEDGVEVRTQGETVFDANTLNNADIEVVRKSDFDKLKRQCSWKVAAKELPTHKNPVAISPSVHGNDFACYNDYDKCWDTADGDDCLCELDEVTYWYEIPEAPRA